MSSDSECDLRLFLNCFFHGMYYNIYIYIYIYIYIQWQPIVIRDDIIGEKMAGLKSLMVKKWRDLSL